MLSELKLKATFLNKKSTMLKNEVFCGVPENVPWVFRDKFLGQKAAITF